MRHVTYTRHVDQTSCVNFTCLRSDARNASPAGHLSYVSLMSHVRHRIQAKRVRCVSHVIFINHLASLALNAVKVVK